MNLIELTPKMSKQIFGYTKELASLQVKEERRSKHMIDQRLVLAKELGRRPTEAEIGQRMKEVLAVNHDKLTVKQSVTKYTGHMAHKSLKIKQCA